MLLVAGLLVLAFGCLTVGTGCLLLIRQGEPRILARLEAQGYDVDETRAIMGGVVGVGLFLLLCAGYIWSHP